jgi:hypothetical protein
MNLGLSIGSDFLANNDRHWFNPSILTILTHVIRCINMAGAYDLFGFGED